jgi:hypothetical protein
MLDHRLIIADEQLSKRELFWQIHQSIDNLALDRRIQG